MNFYYCPGAGLIKGQKQTWLARFRLWKRRRKQADLEAARRWNG